MIALPPGCTVTYAVWVDIDELSDPMVDWFKLIGGDHTTKETYDWRGNKKTKPLVKLGQGKWCHHRQDGTNGVRLHFHGDDASTVSMFMLKFSEHVVNHNLREVMERRDYDLA